MVSPVDEFEGQTPADGPSGDSGLSAPAGVARVRPGDVEGLEDERTGTVVQTTPQLLRFLEVRIDLLRARGLPLPRPDLAEAYARHLAGRALGFREDDGTTGEEGEGGAGWDGRTSDGTRYRVTGVKRHADADVVVPGIPDLAFDRIVLATLGPGYGLVSVVDAPVRPFLRAATYEEADNRWRLPASDPFWTRGPVRDLTRLFRAVAAEMVRDRDFPVIEPFRAGSPRRRRRDREAEGESSLPSPLA